MTHNRVACWFLTQAWYGKQWISCTENISLSLIQPGLVLTWASGLISGFDEVSVVQGGIRLWIASQDYIALQKPNSMFQPWRADIRLGVFSGGMRVGRG